MLDMMTYLPSYMRKSKVLREICSAQHEQIQYIKTGMEDIAQQLSVDTATWGLAIYEKELDIKTDLNKPIEDRRSVIKSKMRGTGKVDAVLIKVVADAYTNGDVIVSFNGHIVVKFTSKIGTPPNLEDLKAILEGVKPAHLKIDYQFRYITIGEISAMTIGEVHHTILDKFAGGA